MRLINHPHERNKPHTVIWKSSCASRLAKKSEQNKDPLIKRYSATVQQ